VPGFLGASQFGAALKRGERFATPPVVC
jgi:hypothetical protein